MKGLMIGELARQAGVAASALRYYEKAGLIPSPVRASNRRLYDHGVLGRIRIILLARDAGFSISETRTFLDGFRRLAIRGLGFPFRLGRLRLGRSRHRGGFGRSFAVRLGRALGGVGLLRGCFVCRAVSGGGGFWGRGRHGGGLLFGGFFLRWDVAYRAWSVFVIACQISLAPRPVAAENGSGSAPSWRMLRMPCSCSD